MLRSSLAAEASNEYKNITVMTSLLPQPTTVQYVGCCGQYRLLAGSHHDDTVTDVQHVSAADQPHRQAASHLFCLCSAPCALRGCENRTHSVS